MFAVTFFVKDIIGILFLPPPQIIYCINLASAFTYNEVYCLIY